MDTSTIILIIVMGWALVIYGGLTYLIVKKKEYSLISGFLNRPKEEQELLKENGYIEALGKVFKITFYLFAASFLLALLPIPYGFEIGIAVFLIVLMGGVIWVQKFEVPKKRKKMYWITSVIAIVTIGFVGGLSVVGFSDNEITVNQKGLEISGMYGIEWPLEEIQSVELLDKLPKIMTKSNGFATGNQLKGRFRLEEPYGSGLLFVKGQSGPFLYVATDSDFLILNRDDVYKVHELYDSLTKNLKSFDD